MENKRYMADLFPKISHAHFHAEMGYEVTLTTRASLIFIAARLRASPLFCVRLLAVRILLRARFNVMAVRHIVKAED